MWQTLAGSECYQGQRGRKKPSRLSASPASTSSGTVVSSLFRLSSLKAMNTQGRNQRAGHREQPLVQQLQTPQGSEGSCKGAQ